jgi:hypothetical protein
LPAPGTRFAGCHHRPLAAIRVFDIAGSFRLVFGAPWRCFFARARPLLAVLPLTIPLQRSRLDYLASTISPAGSGFGRTDSHNLVNRCRYANHILVGPVAPR